MDGSQFENETISRSDKKKFLEKKSNTNNCSLLSTKSLMYGQLSIQSHGCLTLRSKIGSLRKV